MRHHNSITGYGPGKRFIRPRWENLTWTPIKSLQALVCSVLPSYWDIASDVR